MTNKAKCLDLINEQIGLLAHEISLMSPEDYIHFGKMMEIRGEYLRELWDDVAEDEDPCLHCVYELLNKTSPLSIVMPENHLPI